MLREFPTRARASSRTSFNAALLERLMNRLFPTYNCELAQEAFTGIPPMLGLNHRGFSTQVPFAASWNSTLISAIEDVPYNKVGGASIQTVFV
ncbi:hypothetical protein TELCIR_16346 [Teladorsagia circumcincta]|uniref:Uncharacterized protein n=1 Tax=Teladorsagia circumcincta TaxID=45464 RepID=A0A2G9TVQ7_TELCI|nr:hypothetical protein TELCIR_16346 [Teladorsagia circumcincta]